MGSHPAPAQATNTLKPANNQILLLILIQFACFATTVTGLTSVSIKPSKHSGSSRNTGSGSIDSEEVDRNRMPACLMINATVWSSKLQSLSIEGMTLGWLPPCIPQLTRLQCLRLRSCRMYDGAVAALIRQAGLSCKVLQILELSRKTLQELPTEGWEGLSGLKVCRRCPPVVRFVELNDCAFCR